MSNHSVEILEYRKLSDGQFAALARCCGDDMHRSWHTMGSPVICDQSKLNDSISWFVNRVASQHEAALQADVALQNLVGTSVTIELPAPADPAVPVTPAPPDAQAAAA